MPSCPARSSVKTILGLVPVIPFDLIVARTHARIWAELAAADQPIGAHDLLIAATALAHGYAVLTVNVQDFSCFLTRFASSDPYANCDNSTAIPTLNVQDFSCYLTKFATGCSAP